MLIAVDTETTGLDLFHGSAPFMVCTLNEEGEYKNWEWPVEPKTRQVQVGPLNDLRRYLEGQELIFHHADFDIRALDRIGIKIISDQFEGHREPRGYYCRVAKIHDTQLLSHVVNSQGTGDKNSEMGRHALKPLALHYLDIPIGDEKELHKATISARRIGKQLGWSLGKSLDGTSQVKADYWMPKAVIQSLDTPKELIPDLPIEWLTLCKTYCKQDCYRTIGLFFALQEILKRDDLEQQYERELRLLPVTHLMEHFGLHAPRPRMKATFLEMKKKADNLKTKAESFLDVANANSAPQLSAALIKRGVHFCNKTPSGSWKTDASTLRYLAKDFGPVRNNDTAKGLRCIVGWHTDNGDKKTVPGYKTYKTGVGYVTSYLCLLDASNCLHPSYNQVGTAWTRYSCSQPNGQNIGVKAVLPLRKMFGPPPGYIWLDIDYSQLELRIFSYAAQEKSMIEAFEKGHDFHAATAMQLYEVAQDRISKEQRTISKNINFGVIYGAGPRKIDETSGKPGTYQLYLSKFPAARDFMKKTIAQVEKTGYITTLSGYRLYVPLDKAYAAVNAVVQGFAGDVVKLAMIDIHEQQLVDWEPPTKYLPYGGSSIVANIHDALVFQFPLCYPWKSIGKRIINVMEDAGGRYGVVTPVDCKIVANNWAEGVKFAA